MNRIALGALLLLLLLLPPLEGRPASAGEAAGRFTMTPAPNGFLRLDTVTGAVSLCAEATGTWSCRSVADDQAAMQGEIDRLTEENAALRQDNDALKQAGITDSQSSNKDALQIPSDAEVDKAMSFVEKMLKRFKGLMDQLKKDNEQGPSVPL